jgi:hypothetical protein
MGRVYERQGSWWIYFRYETGTPCCILSDAFCSARVHPPCGVLALRDGPAHALLTPSTVTR